MRGENWSGKEERKERKTLWLTQGDCVQKGRQRSLNGDSRLSGRAERDDRIGITWGKAGQEWKKGYKALVCEKERYQWGDTEFPLLYHLIFSRNMERKKERGMNILSLSCNISSKNIWQLIVSLELHNSWTIPHYNDALHFEAPIRN